MLDIIILLVLAAVIVTLVTGGIVRYRAAEGAPWKKLLTAASGSATILWQYIVAAGGVALVWAEQAAQFFKFPEV